jgi:hypothetical protein
MAHTMKTGAPMLAASNVHSPACNKEIRRAAENASHTKIELKNCCAQERLSSLAGAPRAAPLFYFTRSNTTFVRLFPVSKAPACTLILFHGGRRKTRAE